MSPVPMSSVVSGAFAACAVAFGFAGTATAEASFVTAFDRDREQFVLDGGQTTHYTSDDFLKVDGSGESVEKFGRALSLCDGIEIDGREIALTTSGTADAPTDLEGEVTAVDTDLNTFTIGGVDYVYGADDYLKIGDRGEWIGTWEQQLTVGDSIQGCYVPDGASELSLGSTVQAPPSTRSFDGSVTYTNHDNDTVVVDGVRYRYDDNDFFKIGDRGEWIGNWEPQLTVGDRLVGVWRPAGASEFEIAAAAPPPPPPPPPDPPGVEHAVGTRIGEETITIAGNDARYHEVTCPGWGYVLDGTVRVVSVEGGSPADIDTEKISAVADTKYGYNIRNYASGPAEVAVGVVCVERKTGYADGHEHALSVGGYLELGLPIATGERRNGSIGCTGGDAPVAPGVEWYTGVGDFPRNRVSGAGDTSRDFSVVATEAGNPGVSTRCLPRTVAATDGHRHALDLADVSEQVSVPPGATVERVLSCGRRAAATASWDLADGLRMIGFGGLATTHTRTFSLTNPSGAPASAAIGLLCLGDATLPAS